MRDLCNGGDSALELSEAPAADSVVVTDLRSLTVIDPDTYEVGGQSVLRVGHGNVWALGSGRYSVEYTALDGDPADPDGDDAGGDPGDPDDA